MNKENNETVQDTVQAEHAEEMKETAPETEENNEAAEASDAPQSEQQEPAAEAEAAEAAGDTAAQAEIERLRNELSETQQRALRAQADDNFRRRTQKEKEELAKYASSKLIQELLPVIDNFERALQASEDNPEFESFSKGVNMIFRQLEQVLAAEGLTAMNSVGQPFNPEFHQAIMQVESEEHEEGIVVEEVQKGYMLKDKVLRPAMVKVSM